MASWRRLRQGAALVLVLLLLGACSSRERSNPFDPANPGTRGRPGGFVALASDGTVRLSWLSLSISGLQGYALWRRGPGDPDFVSLVPGTLPPDQTSYLDTGVINDSTYLYRIAFVLAGGVIGPTAEAAARPGPGAGWVTDAGADELVRLSPDDRNRTLTVPAPDNPAEIEVDSVGALVWSSSRSEGDVAVWKTTGELVAVDGTFGAPSSISLVPASVVGWVADEQFGQVRRWAPGAGTSAHVDDLSLPGDVASIPSSGGVWIAERAGRRLVQARADGSIQRTVALAGRPWRIALDPAEEDLWITYVEDGVVERRDSTGVLLARATGLSRPFALAVDTDRARVWVSLSGGDAIVALDRSAAAVVRASGIRGPRGVALDRRTGEVWVAAVGEGDGKGAVWLLASDARVLQTLNGFTRPYAVSFEPGPSRGP